MTVRVALTLLAGFISLSACIAAAEEPMQVRSSGEVMTRVLLGDTEDCPVAPPKPRQDAGEALVRVGEAVAGFASGALESYLDDFVSGYSSDKETIMATGNFYRFQVVKQNPRVGLWLRCMTIVRGKFGAVTPSIARQIIAQRDRLDPTHVLTGAGDQLDKTPIARLHLVDYPEMLLVLHTGQHDSAPLFQMVPAYLYFRKSAASQGTAPKDIFVTLTFLRPIAGVQPTGDGTSRGQVIASLPLRIRAVSASGIYPAENLLSETIWAPLPAWPDSAKLATMKKELDASSADSAVIEPFNLLLTYQESGKPSETVRLLVDMFKGGRKGLTDAIQK